MWYAPTQCLSGPDLDSEKCGTCEKGENFTIHAAYELNDSGKTVRVRTSAGWLTYDPKKMERLVHVVNTATGSPGARVSTLLRLSLCLSVRASHVHYG